MNPSIKKVKTKMRNKKSGITTKHTTIKNYKWNEGSLAFGSN